MIRLILRRADLFETRPSMAIYCNPPESRVLEAVRKKESAVEVRSPAFAWLPIVDVIRTHLQGDSFIGLFHTSDDNDC